MRRMESPRSSRFCLSSSQDLRLHGHVECGGRLVGDHQLRVRAERGRDHDALRHPAGELVGERRGSALRLRDAHVPQELHGSRPWPRAGPPCGAGAATPSPGRRPGQSGPASPSAAGTTSRPCCPGSRCSRLRDTASRSSSSSVTSPPTTSAPGGSRPITVSAVRLLPDPDSPTSATISPRPTVRSMPSMAGAPSMSGKSTRSPRMSSSGPPVPAARPGCPCRSSQSWDLLIAPRRRRCGRWSGCWSATPRRRRNASRAPPAPARCRRP